LRTFRKDRMSTALPSIANIHVEKAPEEKSLGASIYSKDCLFEIVRLARAEQDGSLPASLSVSDGWMG
jgi:hypothetical protein